MEEILPEGERVLLDGELLEFRYFIRRYEGELATLSHYLEEESKALRHYDDLSGNARMYVSHFIQVLQLAVLRNEIRRDYLAFYGLEGGDGLTVPDLSTEESLLYWGDFVIRGERERTGRGGIPLYNPAIAKVKIHYELLLETIRSLEIHRRNVSRYRENMLELRTKAAVYIETVWQRVEEKYRSADREKYHSVAALYNITFYNSGDQLNVFD
jgi:hypothetical protein